MSVTARTSVSRFLAHLFFTDLEVEGAARIPSDGAVVMVSNHHSSLIDPMLLLAGMPRSPRFLAKATLWSPKYFWLRPIILLGNPIPVHRRQDGGGDNSQMFDACNEVLGDGEVIGLFAEGISHDLPGLADLRTGAARIALGAANATGNSVTVVPVGMVYDQRERFRSAAILRVGEPIVVQAEQAEQASESSDRSQVVEMTEEIAAGLSEVAPTWEDWETRRVCGVAADIAASNPDDVAEVAALSDRLKAAFEAGDAEVSSLMDEVRSHDRDLRLIGATSHGFAAASKAKREYLEISSLITGGLLGTAAFVGRLVHRPPFDLIGRLASSQDLNAQATAKLIGGIVMFPLWWILWAVVAGLVGNLVVGLVVLGLLPALGYLAAMHSSQVRRSRGRRRARKAMNEAGQEAQGILEQRAEIKRRVQTLVSANSGS